MSPSSRFYTKTQPVTWKIGLFALLISLFWSGNIVSIKFGLETIPPIWSAFWRMLLAVIALTLWARACSKPILVDRKHFGSMLKLSLLFIAKITIFNLGVYFTSPAYSVILLNTNPLMVNVISHFFVHDERLTWQRILGLSIPFSGIVYIFTGQPDINLAPNPLLGNSLMLLSALLLALRIVYTQKLVQYMDPLRPVIWQMTLSLPAFLCLAMIFEPPLVQPLGYGAVLAILYQSVVVAGFCFVAWTTLLQKYSAGNLAVYSFSVPLYGIVLAAVFFGEAVTRRLLASAIIVAVGIAIVMQAKSKKEAVHK